MESRKIASMLVVLALLFAACAGSDGEATAVQAEPTATAAPVPTAEPEPTATEVPAPTATAVPEPTATEVPEPTAEPTPTKTPGVEETTLASGCGSGVAPGITTESFQFEGRERVFEQVVPASYDDATPLPVVLNWHGLGSNGVEQIGFSDYAALAEVEGFIVIAPTGIPTPGDDRNSWELSPEQDPERDDLAFANTLLDLVIESLCVDADRVYTTGMSNGGYFSSVLVCEMSTRIAAAASVAALSHPDDCDPERIVPYIGFHGTDDAVVPFAGGQSSLAIDEAVELFLLEIPAEFEEFAVDAQCDAEPVVTAISDEVISYDYVNCNDGLTMTFYEIVGGGHTWPGSAVSVALSEAIGLGVTTTDISASETSWAYFEQHSLNG